MADTLKGRIKIKYNDNYTVVHPETESSLVTDFSNAVKGIVPDTIYASKTAYTAGTYVRSRLLPSWAYLECTTAGETGEAVPTAISNSVTEGQKINDGTVVWTVRNVGRQNADIIGSLVRFGGSDYAASVVKALGQQTLSTLGVKYKIADEGYICFGQLFGGLTIEWGKSTIYNRFVQQGCLIKASGSGRTINIYTENDKNTPGNYDSAPAEFKNTGTYSTASMTYSQVFIDNQVYKVDDATGVATVPTPTTQTDYYVYLDSKAAVKIGTVLPEDAIGLSRITVPANNSAANLSGCTFTDIRRVEANPRSYYKTYPAKTITLPLDLGSTNYRVHTEIGESSDPGLCALRITDKKSNGFKVTNYGTADPVSFEWLAFKLSN